MAGTLFTILLLATIINYSNGQDFCYDKSDLTCGPLSPMWGDLCRQGMAQSPIDLKITAKTKWEVPSIPKQTLTFNQAYRDGAASGFIVNNGHTVLISIRQDLTSPMTLRTSLFPEDYIFAQVHCHFESEHTYKKGHYPLECHFVHYNSKFATLTDAVNSGDQAAALIIGIFYQDRATILGQPMTHNKGMEPFTQNLARIREATKIMMPTGPVNIYKMMAPITRGIDKLGGDKQGYLDAYSYFGSLTTPVDQMGHACSEGMHWLVFRHPEKISPEQMNEFYAVQDERNMPMRGNFRDTQPLNGRIVTPLRLHIR